jgi:hypothetical protein
MDDGGGERAEVEGDERGGETRDMDQRPDTIVRPEMRPTL